MLCWRFHSGDLGLVTQHDWGHSWGRERLTNTWFIFWKCLTQWNKQLHVVDGRVCSRKKKVGKQEKESHVCDESKPHSWFSLLFYPSHCRVFFVNCLTHQGHYSILNQSLSNRVGALLRHQLLASQPGFPPAQRGKEGEAARGDEEYRSRRR